MTLDNLRNQIDEIDLKIKQLFLDRMSIAQKVAESKIKTRDKILKPKREEEVINQLTAEMDENLKVPYTAFIKKIMEISRTYQYRKMLELGADFSLDYTEETPKLEEICYQGLPCSYSEMAALEMYKGVKNSPVETFEDVFKAIDELKFQAGVLPLENTTAGGIYEVYDLLLKYNLYINESYIVKVEHCLAGICQAELEDIKEVYSHPQAIAQSTEFLKDKGIMAKQSSNTAVAAKDVASLKEKSIGAICSKEAAKRYGLKIISEAINHNKENATKFVGISKKLVVKENHNRVAAVFACSHRSGSLASVLGIFGDYGVNLTEIHSRPDGKNPWEYLFYVDFTGNLKDEIVKALFFQLTEELPFVKILGSYESSY